VDASDGILNIRSGPGPQFEIVATMPLGATGWVGRCVPLDGGWKPFCEVEWQGVKGWASSCCMADLEPATRPPQQPSQHQPQQSQPLESPQQKNARLRVVRDLTLRTAPDPRSDKVMVGPPLNDAIPTDAKVELRYAKLTTDCRHYDAGDAVHTIWCPVFYGDYWGWVNAFYLDTGNGRLSCSIDPTSLGCDQGARTANR
jgi:uncharacterized protein YraI